MATGCQPVSSYILINQCSDPIRLARMVSRGFKLIGYERFSDPIRLVRMVKQALPPNLIHHPSKSDGVFRWLPEISS